MTGPISHLRRHRWKVYALLTVLALTAGLLGLVLSRSSGRPSDQIRQQIAVPAYINPTTDAAAWERLVGSKRGAIGVAVANVENGPASALDPSWAEVIRSAHHRGIRVLGYVNTGYLGTTGESVPGAGSSAEDWTSQVAADVASWYQFYGANLGGIFFDKSPVACGPTPISNQWADFYAAMSAQVKKLHPGALTVLNPGTNVPSCYQHAADSIVTFEGTYGNYVAAPGSSSEAYRPLSWSSSDPEKIWHIIYSVATPTKLSKVLALSRVRRSGFVFATNATLPNPYDTLPDSQYWNDELREVTARA